MEKDIRWKQRFQNFERSFIFGSRALNTHKKGSDIDIALKGKEVGLIASTISGILNEESPLPYFCDVLDYNLIDNEDLRNHIPMDPQVPGKKSIVLYSAQQKKDMLIKLFRENGFKTINGKSLEDFIHIGDHFTQASSNSY